MIPSPVKELFSLIFLYEHLFVSLRKHLEVNESEYTFSRTKNKGEKLINLYTCKLCRVLNVGRLSNLNLKCIYINKDNIFTKSLDEESQKSRNQMSFFSFFCN